MNVISFDAAPKAPVSKTIEGGGQTSPDNTGNGGKFANALKDQESLLKDNKPNVEQTATQPVAAKSANQTEETAEDADEDQTLADLLEKFLPPLADNGAQPQTTENITEAILLTTEDTSTSLTMNALPVETAAPPALANLVTPPTITATTTPATAESTPVTPEETMSTPLTLQKTALFAQATATTQATSTSTSEGSDSFKQVLTTQSEATQKLPEITTEMAHSQRPVEARVENLVIAKPLSHPGWSRDLGEHILWMNTKEVTAAEIRLNPAHLGPISVRIDVAQDNQTSIQFAAQHAETKEALEASLPRLKEMLHGQHLNLVNVNISQNSSSNQSYQQQRAFAGSPQHNRHLDTAAGTGVEINEHEAVVSKGLLSLYA